MSPDPDRLHLTAGARLDLTPMRSLLDVADPYPGVGRHEDFVAVRDLVVAESAADAIAAANAQTHCDPGYCLRNTRLWLGIDARDNDAQEAWDNALHRHPGDVTPPPGAPMFWRGGSRDLGHAALSRYADMRSTDIPVSGLVGNDRGSWPVSVWGMDYLGWSEDVNGVWVPYLKSGGEWRAGGDVWVDKLHLGQTDSDSVARLRFRLANHDGMAGSGHRPAYGHDYGPDCRDGVRYWVRNLCPASVVGPRDGSALSNAQAGHLFGPNYTVHKL